jgi:hypothetical protein
MRKASRTIASMLSLCAVAACETEPTDSATQRTRHTRDAAAIVVDSAPVSASGTVSCYTEGEPDATCTLPVHCCFTNYSSQHDGRCTTSSCPYGTIDCDGPEDCAAGELCCAHAITDPYDGTIGYTLACQTGACGAAPYNRELCHPATGCSTGAACVTAYGNDNDLPRTLYVCQ